MGDGEGDSDADELFETGDIGDQVGVEVIAVESAPEVGVGGLAEEVV